MKKPEKHYVTHDLKMHTRSDYMYYASDMDAYLLEKDENIKLLEMANKNGNYALMDKCDEFSEYVEKTKKRIERLHEIFEEYIPADKMDEANFKLIDLLTDGGESMGKILTNKDQNEKI